MPELPESPDQIRPEWLTTELRHAGVLRDRVVESVKWEMIGEEQGFTGVVARLWPRYSSGSVDESPPVSMVAKFPMTSRANPAAYQTAHTHDAIAARRHFERSAREVRFYEEIAPASPAPAPRCFFCHADDASDRIVLLLEDVSDPRPGDVLAGCSPEDAQRVLDAIASFHAHWWTREPPRWVPRWSGDHRARQERYARQVAPFLDRHGDDLPTEIRSVVEGLREKYALVLAALDNAPATLIHADLHLDNVLFTETETEPGAVILDWQSVASGAAAVDLEFFLVGSLDAGSGRDAEHKLLRHYHARLSSAGVSGYSIDDLRRDYRLALLWHLAGTVGWLANADPAHLAGREQALVNAALGDNRLISALLDHDVAGVLRQI